jgi:hypothetical protein
MGLRLGATLAGTLVDWRAVCPRRAISFKAFHRLVNLSFSKMDMEPSF